MYNYVCTNRLVKFAFTKQRETILFLNENHTINQAKFTECNQEAKENYANPHTWFKKWFSLKPAAKPSEFYGRSSMQN